MYVDNAILADTPGSTTTPTPTPTPTVASTSPTNGGTSVSPSTSITATFSQDMNPSTITTSTFQVKAGTTAVPGTVTYYSGNKTAVFKPSATLNYATQYTVTITTGVKNTAGNSLGANYIFAFNTYVRPAIASTSPVNGTTGVAVSTLIKATFTRDMNPSTLTGSTFIVKYGTTAVSGTITYYSGNKTAVFKPTASLKLGTLYTVTITTGVKDSAGYSLAVNNSTHFTTASK